MAKINIKIIIAITFFSIISTLSANFASAYNESLSSAEYKKIENEIIGLKNASEAHPSNIHIHMRLGYLYLKIDEFEKALEQFAEVSRLKPRYYKASLEAGYLYRKMGKDDLAEQEFKKVAEYGDAESKKKAKLELEDIIETRYRDKLQELIDKVYEAYNRDDMEEAVSYMENLVKMEPENALFRLDLARAYNVVGKYEEAIKELEFLRAKNQLSYEGRLALGLAYDQTDKIELAKEEYSIVASGENPELANEAKIRLDAILAKSALEAGYLYKEIGKYDLAEQEFKKVFEYGNSQSKKEAELELKDIENMRYRDRLQNLEDNAYEAYNKGETEKAIYYFEELLKEDPDNIIPRLDLAYSYISIGKYEEAIKELEFLRAKNQLSYEGRMALGFAYDQTDKIELAKEEYSIVASGKNPELANEAKMRTGYLYEKMGKYDLAEQEFKKVFEYGNSQSKKEAELELENMRYRDRLQNLEDNAYEAYNKGEMEKAIYYFEELIKMDPDNIILPVDLAYAYISIGKYEEAIKELESLKAKNQLSYEGRLVLGLAYDQANKTELAKEEYSIVASGENPELANEAKKELDAKIAEAPAETSLDSISFSTTYYERFDNTVFDITIRQHIFPENPPKPLEFYLEGNFTRDTKSEGGELPDIYSDNIVEVGLGVRLKPIETEYLYLYGIGAVGQKLIKEDEEDWGYEDVRLGVNYYKGWGTHYLPPESSSPKTISSIMKEWGEFGFDISYYDRFNNNIIGYFDIKEGIKILQIKDRDLDGYLRNNTIVDTRGEFYNNLTEVGPGLRFQLIPEKSFYISVEKMWGFYFEREETDPNPYGDDYNDLRVQISVYYEW